MTPQIEKHLPDCVGPVPRLNWTETLMKNIPSKKNVVRRVALHTLFCVWLGSQREKVQPQFTRNRLCSYHERSLKMDAFVQKHSDIMDKYDPQKKAQWSMNGGGVV